MIRFEKNTELDRAMRNLIESMIDEDEYLSSILDYMGTPLTVRTEKEVLRILKWFDIPAEDLKRDAAALEEHPYFRNIRLEDMDSDTVQYRKDTVRKKTLMNMDFHKPLGKYLFHYHPIGYFTKDITMPVLMEGEKVWMSPAVSEIESMRDGIDKGHGRCLTMGLGIGMLPYLWLDKPEVESVTVVEFNPDVIDLFETCIRPQFPTGKPLEIIQGNAIDYYSRDFLEQFDYVYVDFWESSEDGLDAYTRLMEKKVDLPHIDYWIEDSMLADIQYIIAPYLLTLYDGRSITDFLSSLDGGIMEYTRKVNRYFRKRDDVITTEQQLLHLIHSKEVLREILSL
jgi:hypothetical protein